MKISSTEMMPTGPSNKALVMVNGTKAPTNAQVNFADEHDKVDLLVKFKSGMKVSISEGLYRISPEQLVLGL